MMHDYTSPDGSIDLEEVLDSLEIGMVERPTLSGCGTRVKGAIAGHRFDALVFHKPMFVRDWEIQGDSHIAELYVERMSDQKAVYKWYRGATLEPQTPLPGVIVSTLVGALVIYLWGMPSEFPGEEP